MKLFTKANLSLAPVFVACLIITMLTILPTTANTDITINTLGENVQGVENVVQSNQLNGALKSSSINKQIESTSKKKSQKNRRRSKNKNKRAAKRARLLRSEAEQFGFVASNPMQQGSKTLGLQWVLDIRRNLTTLMRGLEQVEQQLTVVKEQLQQKSNVGESSAVDGSSGQQQTTPSPIVCPWDMLNGGQMFHKCYSFHNIGVKSWYQASASCRVVGGRLLRISSAQETAFLLSRAPAWMSSGSAWLTTTWTDGNRLYPCPNDGVNTMWPSETSWGWGTRLDRLCFDQLQNNIKVYSDWLMTADAQAGACVALAVASTNWEPLDCDRPAAYVCERDPVQQAPALLGRENEGMSSTKITAEQEEDGERFNSDAAPEENKQGDNLQSIVNDETQNGGQDEVGGQQEESTEPTDYSTESAKSSDANESVKITPEGA